MISQLDHNVGRLMAALKGCGLEKNTIVIFTSDNGTTHDVGGVDHEFFDSVDGLKGLKGQLYEGGIRVPGIVRWPGKVAGGKVVNQPAYHADIMPTLCALANADSRDARGVDLSPVILGEKDGLGDRKPMIWAGGGYQGQIAVRMGRMKVMRRNLFPECKPKDWEVYDIEADPGEQHNLASSNQELIQEVIGILDRECRVADGFKKLNYRASNETRSK